MNAARSYREVDHWRRYQRFFPEALRCTDATAPVEESWRWGDLDVHVDRYASSAARLTVVLLHGGGGNGRLLAPIAIGLHREGLEVVAPDLPGYGLTPAGARDFLYDRWVDCAVDLVARERRARNLPVVVFGLSLGGMLAYHAAARSSDVAGVIATTLCDPRERAVREAFVSSPLLVDVAPPVLAAVAPVLGGLRLPIRWFSKMDRVANDPAFARLIASDPHGGGCRTPLDFLLSIFRMRPAIEPEDFTRCPVLLAHPGDDRWTPLSASRVFFDRLACDKRLVVLDRCGHIPVEEPGVTQFREAIRAFLDARLAAVTGDAA
jgi:alpha-beta hydrolase superfamily lysophospholipase